MALTDALPVKAATGAACRDSMRTDDSGRRCAIICRRHQCCAACRTALELARAAARAIQFQHARHRAHHCPATRRNRYRHRHPQARGERLTATCTASLIDNEIDYENESCSRGLAEPAFARPPPQPMWANPQPVRRAHLARCYGALIVPDIDTNPRSLPMTNAPLVMQPICRFWPRRCWRSSSAAARIRCSAISCWRSSRRLHSPPSWPRSQAWCWPRLRRWPTICTWASCVTARKYPERTGQGRARRHDHRRGDVDRHRYRR